MHLWLMRHGVAEQRAATGRDRDRRLTVEGIAGVERVIRQARLAGLAPELIVTSPYARTVETGEVAGQLLRQREGDDADDAAGAVEIADGGGAELLHSGALTPDSSPRTAWDELRVYNCGAVLVVTHEPLVSQLTAWLLGSNRSMIEFDPAMLVHFELAGWGAEPFAVLRDLIRDR